MPGVKPARNETNLGFAGNVNAAADRAQGEVLFILNQDTRAMPMDYDPPIVKDLMAPDWLDRMLALLVSDDSIGIAGPRLLFPTGHIQSVGGMFDGRKSPYHRCLRWSNPLDKRANYNRAVGWITGAAVMIRRADFLELGGFDGQTYAGGYFEDVDLCMKMRHMLNKETWYCADSTLIHEAGSTGGNPHFMTNRRAFGKRWDGFIEPDTPYQRVPF